MSRRGKLRAGEAAREYHQGTSFSRLPSLPFLAYGFHLHGGRMAAAPPGIVSVFQAGRREKEKSLLFPNLYVYTPSRSICQFAIGQN